MVSLVEGKGNRGCSRSQHQRRETGRCIFVSDQNFGVADLCTCARCALRLLKPLLSGNQLPEAVASFLVAFKLAEAGAGW